MGVGLSSFWKLPTEEFDQDMREANVQNQLARTQEEVRNAGEETAKISTVYPNAKVFTGWDQEGIVKNAQVMLEVVEDTVHFFDVVGATDVAKSFLQSCQKDLAAKDFSSCRYNMYYRKRSKVPVLEYGIFEIRKLPDMRYQFFNVSTKATLTSAKDDESTNHDAGYEKEFYNGQQISQGHISDIGFRSLKNATVSTMRNKGITAT